MYVQEMTMARNADKSKKGRSNASVARSAAKSRGKKPAPLELTIRRERRINIRATADQESLIRKAAQRRGQNLTDFILHTACDEAIAELAVTRQYMLSPERWKLFLEALNKPPVVKPQLQKLFSEQSVLERS
jgi:uncharacterized protein (DUF1778 family)